MCEAEHKLRDIYNWLKKKHPIIYKELLEIDLEKARKVFEDE